MLFLSPLFPGKKTTGRFIGIIMVKNGNVSCVEWQVCNTGSQDAATYLTIGDISAPSGPKVNPL